MSRFSALLDACALVPIAQADTLLRLAEIGLYRPLWSDRILAETSRALEKIHPEVAASGTLDRRISAMKDTFNDACVVGWETLKLSLNLSDPGDNHVVAAALLGRADVIVTNNLKDFPNRELGRFNLSAQRPDEFLLNQLDLAPDRVMRALAQQAADMQDPREQ
ncbi:PIN domain-containing protein [Corynebacterium mycetoides]|uniref:PIN domain-containing protein n=1 Tax=Corynebacterium mycetoides TaxID=38302 RepID=A0A1G9MUD9_9CORY|nr:PIN domain-containing protein [Corynebacterium mycetoides]SDL77860.1 PIN domain-containing protein [Corynebacterium mycetoides]